MMQIEKFVKSLIPSFQKRDLLESLSLLQEELNELTMPAYLSTLESNVFTSSYRPKARWVAAKQKKCESRIRSDRRSIFEQTAAVLDKTVNHLEYMKRIVKEDFSEKTSNVSITYPKALVLQYSNSISFFVRYARQFLMYSYSLEIGEHSKDATEEPFSKAEIAMLEERFDTFLELLATFGNLEDDIRSVFAIIPDVIVDEDEYGIASAVHGGERVQPVTLGFIDPRWNPFFIFGTIGAEAEDTRYRAAQEEAKALELYLAKLKNVRNGQESAQLDKAIAYHERRLQDLNLELAKGR